MYGPALPRVDEIIRIHPYRGPPIEKIKRGLCDNNGNMTRGESESLEEIASTIEFHQKHARAYRIAQVEHQVEMYFAEWEEQDMELHEGLPDHDYNKVVDEICLHRARTQSTIPIVTFVPQATADPASPI